MIRGAFILAIGFTLGYAKAIQEQDETTEFLAAMKAAFDKLVEEQPDAEVDVEEDIPEVDEVDETPENTNEGE